MAQISFCRRAILLAVVPSAWLTPVAVQAENLIKNGDFSAGTRFWSVQGPNVRIQNAGGLGRNMAWFNSGELPAGFSISQWLSATPGEEYTYAIRAGTVSFGSSVFSHQNCMVEVFDPITQRTFAKSLYVLPSVSGVQYPTRVITGKARITTPQAILSISDLGSGLNGTIQDNDLIVGDVKMFPPPRVQLTGSRPIVTTKHVSGNNYTIFFKLTGKVLSDFPVTQFTFQVNGAGTDVSYNIPISSDGRSFNSTFSMPYSSPYNTRPQVFWMSITTRVDGLVFGQPLGNRSVSRGDLKVFFGNQQFRIRTQTATMGVRG